MKDILKQRNWLTFKTGFAIFVIVSIVAITCLFCPPLAPVAALIATSSATGSAFAAVGAGLGVGATAGILGYKTAKYSLDGDYHLTKRESYKNAHRFFNKVKETEEARTGGFEKTSNEQLNKVSGLPGKAKDIAGATADSFIPRAASFSTPVKKK